jgi:hypothetical protein
VNNKIKDIIGIIRAAHKKIIAANDSSSII